MYANALPCRLTPEKKSGDQTRINYSSGYKMAAVKPEIVDIHSIVTDDTDNPGKAIGIPLLSIL
jgi:hypothetical protein